MSEKGKIEALLAEVQGLRDSMTVPDRDAEFREMEAEVSRLRLAAAKADRERMEAVTELQKVKADIAWTMGKLLIKDLFRARNSVEIPCAAEGWLPLNSDPLDTERIEWINKHGRAGIGQEHWAISIPHHLTFEEQMPDVFNVRDIIDIARGVKP